MLARVLALIAEGGVHTGTELAAFAGIAFVAGGLLAPVWATFSWPVPEIPTPLPKWARAGIVAVLLAGWVYLIVKN